MNLDRIKYRYWEHEVWNDPKTPLVPKYTNIVDGCDPTVAIGDFEMCTGLKDKNGNLIYEGDVVSGRYFNPHHPKTPNPKIKGIVRFVQDRMTWIIEEGDCGYDFEHCMPTKDYFEIIGNTHEQKE